MEPRLTLLRSMRLRQRRDFSRLRRDGQRIVRRSLVLNWHERSEGQLSRLAVITTKKLGNAVTRNRARRLLRSCFRLHQHELCKPVDLVLVARNGIVGAKMSQAENVFISALGEANLLKTKS